MKLLASLIVIFIFTLSLPFFFDKTTKIVKKVDLIYCLGGGFDHSRINKAKELFDKNYSLSRKIIYTGADYSNSRIYPSSKLVEIETYKNLQNTFEEISFLKDYMLKNNYKNVIIITDKYHSLRIHLFIKYLFDFNSDGIKHIIVSPSNRDFFYTYKNSLLEVIKIVFNFIKYNPYL